VPGNILYGVTATIKKMLPYTTDILGKFIIELAFGWCKVTTISEVAFELLLARAELET